MITLRSRFFKKFAISGLRVCIPLAIALYVVIFDYIAIVNRGKEFDVFENYDLLIFLLIGVIISRFIYKREVEVYNNYVIAVLFDINDWNESEILEDNTYEYKMELFRESLANFKVLQKYFKREYKKQQLNSSDEDVHRMRMAFQDEKWNLYNKQYTLLNAKYIKSEVEAFEHYCNLLKRIKQ